MKKIDWSYHRAGCETCRKAQSWIGARNIAIKMEVNARKDRIGPSEALELLHPVHHLHIAKGKSHVHIDLKKSRPADDEILKLIIGPSGNLRAPTLRIGKKLLVGFNEEMYENNLK